MGRKRPEKGADSDRGEHPSPSDDDLIDAAIALAQAEREELEASGAGASNSAGRRANTRWTRSRRATGRLESLRDSNGYTPRQLAARNGKLAEYDKAVVMAQQMREERKDAIFTQAHAMRLEDEAAAIEANQACKGPAEIGALLDGVQPRVDEIDGQLNRPLLTAASEGHAEVVRELLDGGVGPNIARTSDGCTPLYIAAYQGHAHVVRELLDSGADPNKPANGSSPLCAAAGQGHAEVVRELLDGGADLDDGALSLAAQSRHVEVVQLLLERGADPNKAKADNGTTPLLAAAGSWPLHGMHDGHACAEVARLLLARGADANEASTNGGETPLFMAARYNSVELAQLLLDSGADPKQARADNGSTPLHTAIESGHFEVAWVLLENGADVNAARSDGGATPLAFACQQGHCKVVSLLLNHGAVETACSMPSGQSVRKLEDVASSAEMLRLLARKRCAICDKLCSVHKCGRCRLVLYCSKECQRGHWAQHSPVCTEARPARHTQPEDVD
jgi:cytohesin